MGDKQKFTAEQVVKALDETRGAKWLAAEKLGCTEETIRNYEKRYATVRQAATKYRGRRVDVAELKLDQAIMNGEQWAVLFALRTLGKDRGYVERQEVTGKDGEAFVIEIKRRAESHDRTLPGSG